MKFRSKPKVIEAIQWNPSSLEFWPWVAEHDGIDKISSRRVGFSKCVEIETLEGIMIGKPGDWIIKGIQGEFFPCKPDIFEATYTSDDNDEDGFDSEGYKLVRIHRDDPVCDTCGHALAAVIAGASE
jgi:hypothetical protein